MTTLHRTLLSSLAMLALASPESAFANRPGFGFRLDGHDIELKLDKETPNTAANPTHTRTYSATVKKGATFTLDVGQYLMGAGLPEPQRAEIGAPTGKWVHDDHVSAAPQKLDGEEFSKPGPTTRFTAVKSGSTTLVFELDDRPNPDRTNLNSPTHVVWRFEVVVTVVDE